MKLELSGQLKTKAVMVHPDPAMHRVAGRVTFMWPADTSVIVRMFAGDGEHISMPWWAVLRTQPDDPLDVGFRKKIALVNDRFLFQRPDDPPTPGYGLGIWGWSWYFHNHGEASSEEVRLEVGFVTCAMHPPATDH